VPRPDLGTWQTEDGRRWVFTLQPGLTWHDGLPVTSDDVLFTVRLVQDEQYGSPWRPYWVNRTTHKVDDRTVVFDLQRVDMFFPCDAAVPLLPAHEPSGRIGAGPFRLVEWIPGRELRLAAHRPAPTPAPQDGVPEPGRGPLLDSYVFRIVPDEGQALRDLDAGKIDLLEVSSNAGSSADGLVRLLRSGRLAVKQFEDAGYYFLGLNVRPGSPYAGERVRKALRLAVDPGRLIREAHLSETVVHGPALPTDRYVISSPVLFPAEAQQLLAATGWQERQMQILYRNDDPPRERSIQALKRQLAEVGVTVNLVALPQEELLRRVGLGREEPGAFDAVLMGWSIGPDPDFHSLFHSAGALNFTGYANDELDALIEEARLEPDPVKRENLVGRAAALIATDGPYIFLYADRRTILYDANLRGFHPGPFGQRYNVTEWHFTRK
ncbi:MAG: ABC transporter substrate-binding protein, partial [Firmicutes bacterium]|nr:ABC transporter substrate-binding protein [Bacillota bacterium]